MKKLWPWGVSFVIFLFVKQGYGGVLDYQKKNDTFVSKKKNFLFDPFPFVKRFLVKVKNQKLVISDEGIKQWHQGFGPSWSYDKSPSVSLKKSEGVKFGTFLYGQAMVYVRAGFESSPISKSPWDHVALVSTARKNRLSPGLGLEWGDGNLFVSWEIRASLPSRMGQKGAFYQEKKEKASNALLFQARYKLGAENSLKLSGKKVSTRIK